MKNSKKKESFMKELIKALKGEDIKALELHTATDQVLNFPDLSESEEPEVGDKATLDGKAAEGEITLPDGDVYVFEGGVLKEIREKEEREVITEEVVAKLNDQISDLTKENQTLTDTVKALTTKIEGINAKFEDNQKTWNKLKALTSEYEVDDDPDTSKTGATSGDNESKGLAGALKRRKENKK